MVVAELSPVASVIVWGLVLIVVLLAAGAVLGLARKRWLASIRGGGGSAGSGFSIERLEELHEQGQISDEEFERLRREVLGLTAAGNRPPSGSSPPPADDDGNAVGSA